MNTTVTVKLTPREFDELRAVIARDKQRIAKEWNDSTNEQRAVLQRQQFALEQLEKVLS